MRPRLIAARVVVCALAAVPAAGSAFAKEPSKSEVDDLLAKAEQASDDPAKAAALYGQAVATGQRIKLLELEEKAAEALQAWFRKTEPSSADPARAARPKARELLALVMAQLDPKRNGAYVSAHTLAAEVLADSVALGDGEYVDKAAAVLSAHASVPKSGAAAAALAQWADGMLAVKSNQAAKADAALEGAAKTFATNGWLAQAASAATELAALRLAGKNDAKVAQALSIAAAMVNDKSDSLVVQEWVRVVKGRLLGASPAALEPFTKATTPPGGSSAEGKGGRGGRGGRGGSAGGNDVSPLGKYWPALGVDRPFVSVTREKGAFVVKPVYPQKAAADPVPLGAATQVWEDEGGATLFLAGPAVALAMIDLRGTRGQPGSGGPPSRVRAFYLLAEGETWSVSKNGTVTVGKNGAVTTEK